MMKHIRVFAVLAVCVLAFGAWAVLHGQGSASGFSGSTYLTTITDANTGAFSSRSVITFHGDHSIAVIDSGQGGPGVQFSSQQGAWVSSPSASITARTLDFSFPSAGIARVDYNFTTINPEQVAGTITLTVFGLQDDPLDGGGTVV